MPFSALRSLSLLAGLTGGVVALAPRVAFATDHPGPERVEVVVVEGDADDDTVEEIVEVETHHHHHPAHVHRRWVGLHFGTIATPFSPTGQVRSGDKVTSDRFKACLDPFGERYCSALRGFDMRVQYYTTHGDDAWDYPRWVGYFRTGYASGHAAFLPADGQPDAPREVQALSYTSIPLFLGGHAYLFKRSPVRPYGGLGFGFDIVKLQYRSADGGRLDDVSARIGFELHAGIEARISNVVALTGEVMQLWSARRKIDGAPDFSATGLTVMAGVAISIPLRRSQHRAHHHEHHRVRKIVKKRPAPPVVAPPIHVEAPAPAPAPINVNVQQTVNAAPVVAPVVETPVDAADPAAPTPEPQADATPPAAAPAAAADGRAD